MRRLLALPLVVAAALPAVPAHADHLCVERGGEPVVCAPHVAIVWPDRICVTQSGRELICVF